jgi:hypothetical protein
MTQPRTPHPFVADPDLPADHRGRRVCAACHLIGRPDDPRHAMPDVPEQAEHRRRVGEDENGGVSGWNLTTPTNQ